MNISKQQQGQLLDLARSFAQERLVVSDGLADDIALLAVARIINEDGEVPTDTLPAHVRHLVEIEIATHFRRQSAFIGRNHEQLPEHIALMRFVTGARPNGEEQHLEPAAEHIWRDLVHLLDARQRELVRLMSDGVPQVQIAQELGYRSADVVKVTVNRLRVRMRREFVARQQLAEAARDRS